MSDFEFLENPVSKKWVILAPRRSKRPDVAKGPEPVCPFCPGKESQEPEVYRVGGIYPDSNWQIRVVPNKFPFAPIHEIVIHSPDHHKNFGELSVDEVQLILKTYQQRYLTHQDSGQVYIFHNRGEAAGESLPHPHTQLAVLPFEVKTDIPRLDPMSSVGLGPRQEEQVHVETPHFYLFCPKTSQWPDELWIAPKKRGRAYGEITDEEIVNLSQVLTRLILIFTIRHRNVFPFNFYIYPGGDWYLRIIPRLKSLGGFEIGTGVYINTQNPQETIAFIKENYDNLNEEQIKKNLAEYHRHV